MFRKAAVKRKQTTAGRSGAKRPREQPKSEAEVATTDDEADGNTTEEASSPIRAEECTKDPAPSGGAPAPSGAPKEPPSLEEAYRKYNAQPVSEREATKYGVHSLYKIAEQNVKISFAKSLSGQVLPVIEVNGKNIMPDLKNPMATAEITFKVPTMQVGFCGLDPVEATVRNNDPSSPGHKYRKTNPADLQAVVKLKYPEAPELKSALPAFNLMCYLCADAYCKPWDVKIFSSALIEKHREAACGGDKKALEAFIEGALYTVNTSSIPPYLPCPASEAGATGTLEDALKSGERSEASFKITTKFFQNPKKDGPAPTGPDQASIDLAHELGGKPEDVAQLVDAIKMKENWGKKLKLPLVRDTKGKVVPPSQSREAVRKLRNGVISFTAAFRFYKTGDEKHCCSVYMKSIDIVKENDAETEDTTVQGIDAFM